MLRLAWQCMLGPRLLKIYRDGPKDSMYEPEGLEKFCDKIIATATTLFNIGLYTSPFTGMYMLRRGLLSNEESRFMVRCMGGLSCMFALCFVLRGIGRASNPKYVAFLRALMACDTEQGQQIVAAIRRYDFDFTAWPVNYSVANRVNRPRFRNPFTSTASPELPFYQRTGIQALAYAATHTFGLRLIYPGSVSLIKHFLSTALFQGRTHLVEEFDGQRAKVLTADGNAIDTMFIDNRESGPRGKILVVCCEGNSGFYEIGLMTTPAKAGYSVLGWNHPGFAESTGRPYPDQEQNAIDAVIQYAINSLGFLPKTITMYGWSIGGYSATWAAVNYPDVYGLVLDATFDDLLPLAENQMPASWRLLVREVVRTHVDLNVAALLAKYQGPVQLVRRTDDEVICLRPGQLASNRGNDLLMKLVENRHRSLNDETRAALQRFLPLMDSQRVSLGYSTINENEQRALRLISMYMRDYKSSHCTPLPEQHFENVMEAIATTRRNRE